MTTWGFVLVLLLVLDVAEDFEDEDEDDDEKEEDGAFPFFRTGSECRASRPPASHINHRPRRISHLAGRRIRRRI